MKTIPIRLPDELHKEFKVRCAQEETTMNTVVERLISEYVRGKVKPGQTKQK